MNDSLQAYVGATPATTPPLVSVGVPVYNGERFLPELLTSLLNQSFADFELIISDNASTMPEDLPILPVRFRIHAQPGEPRGDLEPQRAVGLAQGGSSSGRPTMPPADRRSRTM